MSAILSFLFLFAAATGAAGTAPADEDVVLGQEFEIKFGRQVVIKTEGLRISFTNVIEDSRCPEGVQCIWAGNGKISLKLNKGRRRSMNMTLNTGLDPRQNSYGGYEIKLVELSPYPKEGAAIKKRNYVVKLIVSRKSP
jgi:hypothetical protein